MPLGEREVRRLSNRIRLHNALVPKVFRKPLRTVFDDVGLVFVHIPKTAGTSVRAGLATLPRTNPRRYVRLRTHARAFEYRLALGEQRWRDYFSFAVVRNPFDLMVSSYFWWLEKSHKFRKLRGTRQRVRAMSDFGEFVRSDLGRGYINEYRGDIFDWISLDGEIIVDHVARVETLADDWRVICDRVGVPAAELPRENTTTRGDYRRYYDDQTAELVAARFHRTIDRFGYRF
jgi:hypothetical protein